jgi:hypothetical protein
MRVVALFALLACLAACSSPPVKEHQQAADAIAAAEAAGAARYALDDLKSAKAAFAQYDDAVAQRDYRLALSRALVARDTAYDAAKHARDARAALETQYDALSNDLHALVKQATTVLAAHPVPRNAARLRQDVRSATTAMQEAGALLKSDDLQGAVKQLKDVSDQFQRDLAPHSASGRRGHGAPARA